MKQFYTNKPLLFATALLIVVLGFLVGMRNYSLNQDQSDYKSESRVDLRLSQKSGSSLERSYVSKEDLEEKDSLLANTIRAVSRKCLLDLSLVSNANSIKSGSEASYTMTIKNIGRTKCVNPSVSVYYSNNVDYVNANPKPTASNYYWAFGGLAFNQSYIISFTTKHKLDVESSDEINIEACATANNSEDACAVNRVAIGSSSDNPGSGVVTEPNAGGPTNPPSGFTEKEYGVWVWDSPLKMTATKEQSVINFSANNKINVIYVTVDDYLDIYNLPEGADKESKKKAYSDAVENFIKLANAKNIKVDALAGWRDWAEPGVTWKAFAIIDYVKEFNATRDTKLRAIQYDVEPYLLPTYETNKAKVLTNFVKLIDDSAKRLAGANIDFSIVIPHFYDSEQRWTPSFSYGGYNTHAFNHLLRIMDTRPNSSIILMSYRNFSEGEDSTVAISQAEVAQASATNSTTKVIVGQETGNVEPDYVTFYNTSRSYYEEQILIIRNTFNAYKNFGGVAVHYIDPFMQLK